MILMTAFQAAAVSRLEGCSSSSSFPPGGSPTTSLAFGGVALVVMPMLTTMVPGRSRQRGDVGASSSSRRSRSRSGGFADEKQRVAEMEQ